MLKRIHIHAILAVFAVSVCVAATPDGSTKAKAIPLTQRDPMKAVAEEMRWMMKLYHYTPLLATRDAVAKSIREVKAGNKSVKTSPGWEHGTLDHNGHLISYWSFATPDGKRDIYFDTGTSINTPGEVARQESARGRYIQEMVKMLKVQ